MLFSDVVSLFGLVLGRIMAQPELRLFLGAALVIILFGLFGWIFRQGREGRL